VAEHEWKFAKAQNACSVCQTAFVPEQRYYSALIQTAAPAPVAADVADAAQPAETKKENESGGMERRDYCTGCFESKRPENIFYFWKTQLPSADGESNKPHRPRIDIDYVLEFFKRLEGDNGPQRAAFRYILALMLARKKVVIFEGKKKDASGGDVHLFREKRGGQIHQVVEPTLSEEEVASVSAELGVLLGLTAPPAKTPAAEAPAAPEAAAAPVAEAAGTDAGENAEEPVAVGAGESMDAGHSGEDGGADESANVGRPTE
jgi:hypothetical protein